MLSLNTCLLVHHHQSQQRNIPWRLKVYTLCNAFDFLAWIVDEINNVKLKHLSVYTPPPVSTEKHAMEVESQCYIMYEFVAWVICSL